MATLSGEPAAWLGTGLVLNRLGPSVVVLNLNSRLRLQGQTPEATVVGDAIA